MASWWDSSGAAILLTGIVTVGAAAMPLVLRARVENRIRREQRHEAETEQWLDAARKLCVALERVLEKHQLGWFLGAPEKALVSWESPRPRAALALRFGPKDVPIELGRDLFTAVELLNRRGTVLWNLVRRHPDSASRPRAEEVYEQFHGEAVYALLRFTEALGGPPAPPRDAFTLPLRNEGVDQHDEGELEQT